MEHARAFWRRNLSPLDEILEETVIIARIAALCAEIEQETREACAQLALQAEEQPLDDNVSVLVYPSGEALAAAIRAGKP